MLALLVALSLSQVTPDSRVTRVERVPGGRMEGGRGGVKAWAFFEAFPLGGAGTTTACSTTPPTGAKGEVLTFARTGNATCTKTASGGLATTGIADGDLVVMSANQPRVEYDSAGTRGLLVESSRTNNVIRSQELDNAAWTKTASVTAPTVTADYATAPDGTLTAERVQFPATTTTDYTFVAQASVCPVGTTATVYLKGTSGSGTIELESGAGSCVTCSFVSGSWSRCAKTGGTGAAAWVLGNDGTNCGSGSRAAQDVLVWGAQCELGAYATSYIPTTSAAVTRNAESPPVASVTPSTVATGCMSLRVQLFTTATNGLMAADATGAWKQGLVTFGGQRAYIGAVSVVGPLAALTAGTHTASMRWDESSTTMVLDGSSTAGAAGTPAATNQVIIGGYNGGNLEPGLYSRIQYDTSPTRCTP